MNNRGQGLIFGIMLFVFAFIVGVVLINPIKEMSDEARDAAHLNCDANNLTTGVAATCVIVDLYLPYFIGAILIGGASFIVIRKSLE